MAGKVVVCGVDTSKLPKLKQEEMEILMKRVKNGDALARDEFVVANLRLVLSVVQRFYGKRDKCDDMFQVGCVGLMKAIDNFDINLNVKFSTYAVPMIIGEIKRYLRDNNAIRVSRSLRDIAYKALQTRDKYVKQFSKEPTIEEIAKIIDTPVKEVAFALDAISDTVSLNEAVYEDGDAVRIMDQIADTKHDDDSLNEILSLKNALTKLDKREREILLLRYFIGKTQIEVSDAIGISQAQVSRLEKNAIDSIREDIR
ncbi:MAG: RNA polymerase sporulation sigma factor SigG [Eubacteriales bacterium]|nr:RNA polymerase sporulation sigma factor SigG [Eubacteriales bacterium]